MAYYFRNVSGSWSTVTNWSTTDGGIADQSVIPAITDDVFFTANSGDCSISGVSRSIKNLDFTGYNGTFTLSTGFGITINGTVFTLSPTMTFAAGQTGFFTLSTTGATIRSNGKALPGSLTVASGTINTTLADNFTVGGTLISSASGTKTFNGFSITCSGLTVSATMQGTTSIILAGTGTWSGSLSIANPITINTAGTVTISGSVNPTGSYTYIAGTLVTTGSTMTFNGLTQSINPGAANQYNNVTLSAISTYALGSNWDVNGTFISSSGAKVINGGFTIFCGGSITITNPVSGNINIVVDGTGTMSSASSVQAINISGTTTINTAGTITISGLAIGGGGNFIYQTGTISPGGTLYLGAVTFTNFPASVQWSLINVVATSANVVINQDLHVTTFGAGTSGTKGVDATGGAIIYATNITQVSAGGVGNAPVMLNTTGTWSGNFAFQQPVTINAPGQIITISGAISIGASFTYIDGAIDTTGSTLTLANGGIFDSKTVVWETVTSVSGAIVTIIGNLNCGTYTSTGAGVRTMNGGTLNCNSLTLSSTGSLAGTTAINISNPNGSGTGTWSGTSASNVIGNGVTINTPGTLNMSGVCYVNGNFVYQNGTINAGTASLYFGSSTNIQAIDCGGSRVTWFNVQFPSATGPYTYTLLNDIYTQSVTTSGSGNKIVNGFSVYSSNVAMTGGQLLGTSKITLNGTGSWTMAGAGGYVANDLNIDTLGTFTVSGNVEYRTGILKYTKGTVVTTGSLLTCAADTRFDTTRDVNNKIVWNNVTLSNATSTYTFTTDFYTADGSTFLSSGGGLTKVFNGATIYIGGSLTISSGSVGTAKVVLMTSTTGTFSFTGSFTLQHDLTIDATGTVTIGSATAINWGILTTPSVNPSPMLKYIRGTIIQGGAISIRGECGFDTNVIDWGNNITIANNSTPFNITLNSQLLLSTLTVAATKITWKGTAGFTCNTLAPAPTSSGNYTNLTPGNLYRVKTSLVATSTDPTPPMTIVQSAIPGTKATLTLDAAATCSVSYVNFVDIDASGGRQINTFNGSVIDCVNVFSYASPMKTISYSFAA